MAGPVVWDRILPGFSSEWLPAAAEQQQAIEQCLADLGNLENLVRQHSKGQVADPCNLSPFLSAVLDRDASHVTAVTQKATAAQSEIMKASNALFARVTGLVAEAGKQDQSQFAQELTNTRGASLQEVRRASDLLGEIADPERSKSQSEVLSSIHGADHVASMRVDDKDAAYKQIRTERISQREDTAFVAAQALSTGSQWREILDSILAEERCADRLSLQAAEAISCKGEVGSVVDDLEQSLKTERQRLSDCKAHKLKVSELLDRKRNNLKNALQALQKAEGEYRDAHIEHEALRLQVTSLDKNIADRAKEAKVAKDASQLAVDACDLWLALAAMGEQSVRRCVASSARSVALRAAESTAVAALNVQTATMWLKNLLQDKDAEVASLDGDCRMHEEKVKQLKAQMAGNDPSKDITFVQMQCARQKDEQQSCKDQLAKCQRKREEVQTALDKARAQSDRIKKLGRFGCVVEESEVRQRAQELATESYTDFPLWLKGKADFSFNQADEAGAGPLQALPPNMKDIIAQLFEEKKMEWMQQLKADLLVRSGTAGASSEMGSEAGESVIHDIASSAASASWLIENCAVASDAGSV